MTMQMEAITHYSQSLDRDMHMMIYGQGGVPFLAFPTQNPYAVITRTSA